QRGGHAHLTVADEDQRTDVTLSQSVHAYGLDAGALDLLRGERNLQAENLGGVEQPPSVLREAKDRRTAGLGLIAANPLEDADAIVKRMREHVNFGIAPVDEPSVHPDLLGFLHVSLRERRLLTRSLGRVKPPVPWRQRAVTK